jgi:hypothetical protein
MFLLYRKQSFTKRWKNLGCFQSFTEAYETLNAVMSGYPLKNKQTFRILSLPKNA